MSQMGTAQPGAMTGWNAAIDALATTLMIEGEAAEPTARLRRIGREAREAGAHAVATTVDSLIQAWEADQKHGVEFLLNTGLNQLRAASQKNSESAAAPASLGEDAELVADFLVESREHLSQIEGQMLQLERDPSAREVVHAVFRAFHTIKGLAGFLDFGCVQAVAHEVETLLDLARNNKLNVDSAIVDLVLQSADCLLSELSSIEDALNRGVPLRTSDNRELISRIRAVTATDPVPAQAAPAVAVTRDSEAIQDSDSSTQEKSTLTADCDSTALLQNRSDRTSVSVERSVPAEPSMVPLALETDSSVSSKSSREPRPLTAGENKDTARSSEAGSIRIDAAKLDHLMDMVGEIVIAQSLVRHDSALASLPDSRLQANLSQLARVTTEVQRATMSMRMVPVGNLFQRVERAIRDLSRKAGKQVILEAFGTDTEIDKTVAEELADPLLHMVRNSVDHGIEVPADRVAAGKVPEARIRLSAFHQAGQVIIQISDDGRGLNCERIRRKAEERKLIAPGAQLTESEVYQLIFEPGFSTAERITDVSGRGVGMDVVRRNVEKLRGRIETQSSPGQGTTFLLKLPLTLAIIDGLVVEVSTERYIIPLSAVREIFRPRLDTLFTVQGRDEMVLVRDQLMPIVRLSVQLELSSAVTDPSAGLLVVVESENRRFCLLVDDLVGKQEVVIKALGEVYKDLPGISGCAVLGDGRVGLILDIDGVYRGGRR